MKQIVALLLFSISLVSCRPFVTTTFYALPYCEGDATSQVIYEATSCAPSNLKMDGTATTWAKFACFTNEVNVLSCTDSECKKCNTTGTYSLNTCIGYQKIQCLTNLPEIEELSYSETLYDDEECKGNIVGRVSYPSGSCVYGRKIHNCEEKIVQTCSEPVEGCNTTREGICNSYELSFSSCTNQIKTECSFARQLTPLFLLFAFVMATLF